MFVYCFGGFHLRLSIAKGSSTHNAIPTLGSAAIEEPDTSQSEYLKGVDFQAIQCLVNQRNQRLGVRGAAGDSTGPLVQH